MGVSLAGCQPGKNGPRARGLCKGQIPCRSLVTMFTLDNSAKLLVSRRNRAEPWGARTVKKGPVVKPELLIKSGQRDM